jgi:high-affinity iron transporter
MMIDWSAGAQSATILLREGLEALLVIASLSGFLKRMDAHDQQRALLGGAGIGVLASFVAAWVFERFFDGVHNDLVEAVVMAFAAILMVSVSGWLYLRQDPRARHSELRQLAARSLGGSAAPMAGIAFLAVFREGGETILFLHALANSSGGWTGGFIGGLVFATATLCVLFLVMQRVAVRLPLRPIFFTTSAVLFLTGLEAVAGAIQELQEQALFPIHSSGLEDILVPLGLNATWEAVGLQCVILAVAGMAAAAVRLSWTADSPQSARAVAAE